MHFEKVSYEQFLEGCEKCGISDWGIYVDLKEVYDNIKIPVRGTKFSAAYDFSTPFKFSLQPHESIKLPSGIRVKLDNDKVLMIAPRSSTGMKGLSLNNTLGVIDAR